LVDKQKGGKRIKHYSKDLFVLFFLFFLRQMEAPDGGRGSEGGDQTDEQRASTSSLSLLSEEKLEEDENDGWRDQPQNAIGIARPPNNGNTTPYASRTSDVTPPLFLFFCLIITFIN